MNSDKKVLILGAGPAGLNSARILAQDGFTVTIIDKEIGGNYCRAGSIISNALLHQSRVFSNCSEKLPTIAEGCANLSFDFKKSRKLTEQAVSRIRKAIAEDIENARINFVYGVAKFASPNSVIAVTIDGEKEFTFDYCIVSTGSSEINPGINSSVKLLNIANISELEKTPARVVVLGGGFVGCEFATIFRRLGSSVTIIEAGDAILRDMDQQVVKKFEERLKKNGTDIIKSTKVEKIEKVGSKHILFLSNGSKIEAEEVFVAVGRKANIANLNLAAAGVELNEKGNIKLDDHMRSTNPKIYVSGDASGGTMLVSWAFRTSEVVTDSIMGVQNIKKLKNMPKVLYLDPEIAKIGHTEEELEDYDGEIACIKYNISDLEKSLISGAMKGYMKVVYDKDTKQILGCHVLSDGAGQICSMFSLLMQSGVTIDKISDYVFNHPTYAEVLNDIATKVKQ